MKVKRIISTLLVAVMIMSVLPITSFAAWCDVIGHDVKWVETTPATCTAGGVETEKCAREGCTYTTGKTRTTSVKSHTIQTIAATAPTCDKPGNKEGQYCSTCDLVIKECETIPAIGHTPVNFEAKEATCTENGRTAGTECSVCKKILTGGVTQVATGHNLKLVSFRASSCAEEGWEIWECKTCGVEITKRITAEHNFSGWTTVAQATCVATGKMTRACRDCGVTESKTIDMLSHTEVTVSAKEATCFEDGHTAGKKCSICGSAIVGCFVIPKSHKADWEIIVDSSCAKTGERRGYCTACKADVIEVIPLKEHNYVIIDFKSPSCTEAGWEILECKTCSKEITKTVAAEHNFSGWTTVAQATCTAVGKMTRACRECGITESKTIDMLSHTEVIISATAATCTEPGTTAGKKCTVCNGIVEGCQVIPALGHTEVVVKGTAAGCGTKGVSDGAYCSVCKTIIRDQVEIAAREHNLAIDKAASVAATCTSEGKTVEKCQYIDCGFIKETIVPKTHEVNWTVNKEATCTEAGKRSGYCTACKKTVVETIEPLGHLVTNALSWRVETPATCTKDGVRVAACSRCTKQASEPIPAIGHDYTKDKAQCKEPDCINEGKFYGVCSRCGDIKDEVIPAKGHDEEVEAGTPADCTLGGTSDFKKCKVCGVITAEPYQTPALGHDYIRDEARCKEPNCTNEGKFYGVCSRCGYIKNEVIAVTDHIDKNVDKVCDVCSSTLSGVNSWCSIVGHQMSWYVIKAATCTSNGEEIYKCSRQGCYYYSDKRVIVPAFGHNIDWKIDKEANCAEEGSKTGYCLDCNEFFVETIPVNDHNYQPTWQIIHTPTCTQTGISIKICKDCFNIRTNTLPIIDHADANADGKCDMCGSGEANIQPDTPNNPDEELNFFQKIIAWFKNIIDKLFGRNN